MSNMNNFKNQSDFLNGSLQKLEVRDGKKKDTGKKTKSEVKMRKTLAYIKSLPGNEKGNALWNKYL